LKEQETLKTDTALPLGKTDSMIFSGQRSSHGKITPSFRPIFVHKVALYGFKKRLLSMLIPLIAPRSQTVILKRGWNVKRQPFAFTEHGAIMAANILNSPTAEAEGAAPPYRPARAVSR